MVDWKIGEKGGDHGAEKCLMVAKNQQRYAFQGVVMEAVTLRGPVGSSHDKEVDFDWGASCEFLKQAHGDAPKRG